MKKITIHVYGLVQGVFFRYTPRKAARKLELTGIVKNLSNGSVYIEAEGSEDKLQELLNFAKKGPIHAKVERIEFTYSPAENRFKGFEYDF